MSRVRNWINTKFIVPASTLRPQEVGLSLAVGIWGGIFPIPALSTFATVFLCSTVLFSMFNTAMTTIALSVNLAVTPLQLLFMPIFLSFVGFPISSASDVVDMVKSQSILESISSFGKGFMYASGLWAVLAPVMILIIQALVVAILKFVGHSKRRN
jgi:hypothetical protein